jgi:hypothetical protein
MAVFTPGCLRQCFGEVQSESAQGIVIAGRRVFPESGAGKALSQPGLWFVPEPTMRETEEGTSGSRLVLCMASET